MSYSRLFYHLVWPTKDHQPLITPHFENELFTYITKKSKLLECNILEINGIENHIHVIIEIPPKLSVAEVVHRIKGSSSHEFPDLYWAVGYGAFTVSEKNLNPAINYVRNQKIHHQNGLIINQYECFEPQNKLIGDRIKEDQSYYISDGLDF